MGKVYVSRCKNCDGVVHEARTLLWPCPRCQGAECLGLVDSAIAPAFSGNFKSVGDGIASGRFYENTQATDGTDIGSRKKHREYMKQNNLTLASDYTGQWEKAAQHRERVKNGEMPSKTRREAIERAWHQKYKP